MATSRVDEGIARLYQIPLADFTAARNVLAKQAGARAAEVKALQKPPVAAWAINQLFWQRREAYDRLIGAAGDLRAAHGAVLAGKSGDVRAAGRSHEEAIEGALKATLALLRDAGQAVTDATKQAVATTLRALPAAEPPGQLSATLQPGGFEMLTGLPVRGKPVMPTAVKPMPRPADAKPSKADAEADRRAREAAAEAERAARLAEHAVRREEFEAARATREAEKAAKVVTAARAALHEAEEALKEAEIAAQAADEAKDAATERATAAEAALAKAQTRLRILKAER
ncbi:MAG: hypothetical protein ABIX28_05810 [Vicinamibacterales bacterium]